MGHGYRTFWSLGLASPKYLSDIDFIRTIGSAHNGFLDVALDLGAVGVSLVVLVIIVSIYFIGKRGMRSSAHSLLFYSIVFFTLGRNMTESVIMWSTFLDNLLFITVGLLASIRPKQSWAPTLSQFKRPAQ